MRILLLLIVLSSCTVTERMANRRIAKYKKMYPSIVHVDTVEHKLIIPERVVHDTTIVTQEIDTITFEKEKIKVKLIRSFDTIKIDSIICQTDTITQKIEVPVEIEVIKHPNWFQKNAFWLGVVVVLFVLLGLRRLGLV